MKGPGFREIFFPRRGEPRLRASDRAGAATRQATDGGDDTQSSAEDSV